MVGNLILKPESNTVTIPVQVPIETIIVGNEFILSLVVQFALEIHVLEDGKVGLVAGQRDGSHVH